MFPLSIVVILALLGGNQAYPNGAPSFGPVQKMLQCQNTQGAVLPGHKSRTTGAQIMPQAGTGSYQLKVDTKVYRPGSQITVTLSSTAPKQFKGFFVYIKNLNNFPGDMGTWKPGLNTVAKAVQFCEKGITHSDSSLKSSVSVIWTAPANFTHGNILFKAVVVETHDKFYTIDSEAVNADPTAKTHKDMMLGQLPPQLRTQMEATMARMSNPTFMADMQRKAQQMMSRFGGMMGGQGSMNLGGLLGGLSEMGAGQGGAGAGGARGGFDMQAMMGKMNQMMSALGQGGGAAGGMGGGGGMAGRMGALQSMLGQMSGGGGNAGQGVGGFNPFQQSRQPWLG